MRSRTPAYYEAKRKNGKSRRHRHALMIAGLKNVPCADCGNHFPPECMDFDHVRGEKEFNISWAATRSQKVVLEEIEKCEVVCANCHRIRTKNRRET